MHFFVVKSLGTYSYEYILKKEYLLCKFINQKNISITYVKSKE
jgi:hypothetical protein